MVSATEKTVTLSSKLDAVKKKTSQQEKTDGTIKQILVKSCDEIKIEEKSTDPSTVHTKDATLNLRRIFQFLGFRMPERLRFFYIMWGITINGTICVFFPISCLISYYGLIKVGFANTDVGLFLTSFQLFFNILACEFKLLTLVLMQKKWRSCYPVMERLDERCRDTPEAITELRRLILHGNRWMIFYLVAYGMYATSTAFGAYMKDRPSYNVYLPYLDWHASTLQFWVVSFFELFLVYGVVVIQAFDDSFAVVHVSILRTHMGILLQRFSNLGSESMTLQENYDSLKQCIRDHKTYLELYDHIAPVIQITVFIQFLLTANLLSTTLVNFMMIETDFTSRVGHFFYIVAIFLEISPVCYNAQCLMDDGDRLATVIFHSNWIDQDPRYRKMLIFLMQRTQNAKMLTAGKLFPINLSCCLSIFKFSFTLYTFIKTMGLEEKFENLGAA